MYDCITNNLLSWATSFTSFSHHSCMWRCPMHMYNITQIASLAVTTRRESLPTSLKNNALKLAGFHVSCAVRGCDLNSTKLSKTLTSAVWRIIYPMCLSGCPQGAKEYVGSQPTRPLHPWINDYHNWTMREKLTYAVSFCIDRLAGKSPPTFGAGSIWSVWSSLDTWPLVRTLNCA